MGGIHPGAAQVVAQRAEIRACAPGQGKYLLCKKCGAGLAVCSGYSYDRLATGRVSHEGMGDQAGGPARCSIIDIGEAVQFAQVGPIPQDGGCAGCHSRFRVSMAIDFASRDGDKQGTSLHAAGILRHRGEGKLRKRFRQ
ncbi:MAG: hypothetical protein BWX80_02824 [Candidatus Hydrogenedentes bacterium ADurb.Bin101]|nr:MAG: hypothetical protein BWX80_02824 [Candidatus Hydrogenedentes bacterium ADurb.Bin101]